MEKGKNGHIQRDKQQRKCNKQWNEFHQAEEIQEKGDDRQHKK